MVGSMDHRLQQIAADRVRVYAGVGSRDVSSQVADYLSLVAEELARRGYELSTGDANGSDAAFIRGARRAGGRVSIYSARPNRKYPEAKAMISQPEPLREKALALARRFHPGWDTMVSKGMTTAMLLHARNGQEVLGETLDKPVRTVLCWAEGSVFAHDRLVDVAGGTGQAVRIAAAFAIPVYNLALSEHRHRVERMLGCSIGARLPQSGLFAGH